MKMQNTTELEVSIVIFIEIIAQIIWLCIYFSFKMFDDVGDYVEGEMSVSNKKNNIDSPEFNTLDEPIRDTIVNIFC